MVVQAEFFFFLYFSFLLAREVGMKRRQDTPRYAK